MNWKAIPEQLAPFYNNMPSESVLSIQLFSNAMTPVTGISWCRGIGQQHFELARVFVDPSPTTYHDHRFNVEALQEIISSDTVRSINIPSVYMNDQLSSSESIWSTLTESKSVRSLDVELEATFESQCSVFDIVPANLEALVVHFSLDVCRSRPRDLRMPEKITKWAPAWADAICIFLSSRRCPNLRKLRVQFYSVVRTRSMALLAPTALGDEMINLRETVLRERLRCIQCIVHLGIQSSLSFDWEVVVGYYDD